MNITLTDKDYILVKPMVVRKKSKTDLVFDAKAGLRSSVLTYLVVDCNGDKKYENKVVGIMRSEVWVFETMNDTKHYLVKKAMIIFTVDIEDDEEMIDPYSQQEYEKQLKKSTIIQ